MFGLSQILHEAWNIRHPDLDEWECLLICLTQQVHFSNVQRTDLQILSLSQILRLAEPEH